MLARLVALMIVTAQVDIVFSLVPALSPGHPLSNGLSLTPALNLNAEEWPMLPLELHGLSPF